MSFGDIARTGHLLSVATADPAANAEFTITVTAEKFWRPLAVTVSCVQGITQTPFPALVIDDGANILFQGLGAPTAQNASVTCQYSWGNGVAALTGGGAATVANAPLPDLLLPAGYRIRSVTGGIGANTNYGPARLLVVEYDGLP